MYIVHCTQYSVHCTVYSVYCIHCIVYIVHDIFSHKTTTKIEDNSTELKIEKVENNLL